MIRKSILTLLAATAIAASASTLRARDGDHDLQMVSIDVEGGGGTLFVTPEGKSLLIDSGNPEDSRATGAYPSSKRIVDAMRELGVSKIDYLLTTHYHVDHVGGLPGLLARVKVGTFIDHGPNREVAGTMGPGGLIGPDGRTVIRAPTGGQAGAPPPAPGKTTADYYDDYIKAIGGQHHVIAKPGDVFHIGSLTVTIVTADAKMISKPLPGAGAANPECAAMPGMEANGGEENTRSVSSVLTYGKVRIAAFGDLTWDREKDLFCPNDKVGKVDIYLASHHGTQWSGSPAMVDSLQPIVTIMGDAINKGDDPNRVKTIQSNPRFQALWRLHMGRGHADLDGDPDMIANSDADQGNDKFYNLRLRIRKNGDIIVINESNGFNKTYHAGG